MPSGWYLTTSSLMIANKNFCTSGLAGSKKYPLCSDKEGTGISEEYKAFVRFAQEGYLYNIQEGSSKGLEFPT